MEVPRWLETLTRAALCIAAAVAMAVAPAGTQQPDSPVRIFVSLEDRSLWVLGFDGDTLLEAPVAVGKGTSIRQGRRTWTFTTPRGERRVIRKDADPIWVPPDWFYIEVAQDYGLDVRTLPPAGSVALRDRTMLTMRDDVAGIVGRDGVFRELPLDEHIVFDGALFIPPLGSRNRHVEGELGRYRLDIGDGIYLHGTPHTATVGYAATHGCLRLRDEDIEWLYEHVPAGTRVFIY